MRLIFLALLAIVSSVLSVSSESAMASGLDAAAAADLRESCRSLNGEACSALAWRARRAGDRAGAMADFRRACYRGHPASCEHFATLALAIGDRRQGQEALEEACRHGLGDGCRRLALLGKQVSRQKAQSACSQGSISDCMSVGDAPKACLAGDSASCRRLAPSATSCDSLTGLGCFQLAERTRRSGGDATPLYATACAKGETMACPRVATPAKVRKDPDCKGAAALAGCEERLRGVRSSGSSDQVMALASKLCDMQSAYGCLVVGEQHMRRGAREEGIDFFKRSCELKEQQACLRLAAVIQTTPGAADPKAKAVVQQSLQSTCNAGDGKSCYQLGVQERQQKHDAEAMRYFQKACGFGYGLDCPAH